MEKDSDEIEFSKVRQCVKVNQFPGQWILGRKDHFTRIYNDEGNQSGYNFYPETFVLPEESEEVIRFMNSKRTVLLKPPNWFSGLGIKITDSIGIIIVLYKILFRLYLNSDDIPMNGSKVVVQEYVERPLLINRKKFDIRVYVLLTDVDPLQLYIFNDGIVSFCTEDFTMDSEQLKNKFVHLSNYSINKNNEKYNSKEHRWKLSSLWKYLKKEGIDCDSLWERTKDVCLKSILCGLSKIREDSKEKLKSHYSSFKLIGIDIMYDDDLKPWLLEVHILNLLLMEI